MRAPTDNRSIESETEKVIAQRVHGTTEEALPLVMNGGDRTAPRPAAQRATSANSRASILGVVDASGKVIPVFTAADLLLELKAIWRASQN